MADIAIRPWARRTPGPVAHWAVVSWDCGSGYKVFSSTESMQSLYMQAKLWAHVADLPGKRRLRYLGEGDFEEWNSARIAELVSDVHFERMPCDKCSDDMGAHEWVIVKWHEGGPQVVACDRE